MTRTHLNNWDPTDCAYLTSWIKAHLIDNEGYPLIHSVEFDLHNDAYHIIFIDWEGTNIFHTTLMDSFIKTFSTSTSDPPDLTILVDECIISYSTQHVIEKGAKQILLQFCQLAHEVQGNTAHIMRPNLNRLTTTQESSL